MQGEYYILSKCEHCNETHATIKFFGIRLCVPCKNVVVLDVKLSEGSLFMQAEPGYRA